MNKDEIAEVLEEIGELLELRGENPFKVRAYESGARALESLEEDLGTLIDEGRLGEVKGIGKALVEKISALHATGRLDYYDELKASVPPGLLEMLTIPGFGPKKIKKVYDALGVDSIAKLTAACEEGRVAELPGFGKKTQEKLLAGIRNREAYGKRRLWWEAQGVAAPILEGLRSQPGVEEAAAAGSLRRLAETVGDLDFLASSREPEPLMEWFCTQPAVREVTARGTTKSSIRLEDGLQADLRVVPPEQYAFALHHFTGSKDHNVAMRGRALRRGVSLSEWGLEAKEDSGRELAAGAEKIRGERELFARLGLAWIPPELREGAGEIEAAEEGELPELVREEDIRGVFHNHTTASDGRATLEEMAAEADARGWDYLGIADHSKAAFQASGLDEERLAGQVAKIRELNAGGRYRVHVFAGNEVDILKTGELDFADEVLASLDYVVASVHQAMSGQDEEEMTARIVRAIENPHVTMLGHPTGRLLLRREGYPVNHAKIIDAAAANGVVIEINANPNRLDMDWRYWRRAAEKGVLASINPDAHSTEGLGYFKAGVNVARKGWLTRGDVLNTQPLDAVKAFFARR